MWKRWKELELYWKIIIGMFIGILWGITAVSFGWHELSRNWVEPWGTIFLNMLRLIAVPLVFVSLVKGMVSLTDLTRLSRIGIKTIGFYLASTVVAITIGLLIVNTTKPGEAFPDSTRAEMLEMHEEDISVRRALAEEVGEAGPLQFVVDIVPPNLVEAASDNRNILQIIFFAFLTGLAIALIPRERLSTVHNALSGVNEVIVRIVMMIMKFAPFGVIALMASLVVEFAGDDIAETLDMFASMGFYMLIATTGFLSMIFIVYPSVIMLFTPIRYRAFYKAIIPAQMIAFSTSSTAAALPVTMRQVEGELGVSKTISGFVLPVGVTFNMDGTAMYQAIAAVFIAQVIGIELTVAQQLTIVLTATLASIGTPSVPSAGIVMLVIILTAVGLPAEGLAIIMALDRPLDMVRTIVNITGDCVAASIIAKSEHELNYPPQNSHNLA